MQLYICEKPSQAKDYANALGIKGGSKNGYIEGGDVKITWCIGHLLTPLQPADYGEEYEKWTLDSLPILPKDKWAYKANSKTKSQLKVIVDLLKTADEVVIASDADREGELIVVSILEKFKYKGKRSRVLTGSLDQVTLKKAIQNKKDAKETFNEYLSALTRQKADWIHGMNLTRAMSIVNKGMVEGVLSIGRVQTAVLNLVVTRDLEIESFKSKDFYEMSAIFNIDSGFIKTSWNMPKSFIDEVEGKCIDKSLIESVISKVKGKNGIVTKSEKTRKSENAPLLFSLSELQKECDSKFGIGANDTLSIAQSLYEKHKATTYPRSDCQYLNDEQFLEVNTVFSSMKKSDPKTEDILNFLNNADLTKKTKVWNSKIVSGSSHHAIVPTLTPFNISDLNDNEFKVYDLIRRRYIAQFYPEAESDLTKIEIECEGEIFKASGSMPVLSGWKDIIGKKSEEKELPVLNKGDAVNDAKPKIEGKQTKPPARYTEGSLIEAMKNPVKYVEDKMVKNILAETGGIGTEATRANIIEVLYSRDYAKKDKKNVISTTKGRSLIEYAPDKSKSIEMTAYWETKLEKISKGEINHNDFLKDQEDALSEMLNEIKSGKCTFKKSIGSLYNCNNCQAGLRKIKSKKNGKTYWVCMAGDTCQSIFEDNRGKPLIPKKVEQGDVEHTCEVCKTHKLIRKISKNDVSYWQCSNSECKQFYSDKDMMPVIYIKEDIDQGKVEHICFKCNKNKLERKKGQYGFYWKCTGSKCLENFKDDNLSPVKPIVKEKATSEHKCPNCSDGRLVKKEGKKGAFWGCNAFPKCRTILSDKDGLPDKK